MFRRSAVLMVVLSLVFFSACGGGGDSTDNVVPASADTNKVSTAAVGVANVAGGQGVGGVAQSADTPRYGSINSAILEAVAERVKATRLRNISNGVEKAMPETYSFDDIVVSVGGGTVTLSGTLTGANSGENPITVTISGNLNVSIENVTQTVPVDGVNYTETVNGDFVITFSGTMIFAVTGETMTINVDMSFTTSGENITVTGDASGTVDSLDITVDMSSEDLLTAELSYSCGGTVKVTVTGSAQETCTLKSDCSGCQ